MARREREMTTHQRSLVDNCFEEGQYESGMAVLDQLRSPSSRPSPDHVRQLLYIALFPPPPTGDQSIQRELSPPSPFKGSPTRQRPVLSKASLSPSPAESETAQRILFSFLATNSPGSLFRALPGYSLDDVLGDDDDDDVPPGPNTHDEDSLIAKESLSIKDSKNCWAILKEGFIQRKQLLPQDSRKKRTRGAYDTEDVLDHGAAATPATIAEHAWPILQWLLSLFEKDESLRSQKSGEKFSLLLLSQIPPPRGGGPRWDASPSLDIVFHSIDQKDGERRDSAIRLLTLLINLARSRFFSESMFAATLTTRLYTSSPQIIQNLMESLPKTAPVLAFKISVCQKFLSSSSSIAGGTKPRPRPLARHGSRHDSGTMSSATDNLGQTGSPRPALPTFPEIAQLLRSDHESRSVAQVLTAKYVLLVSYAQLQGLLPPGERDSDWKQTLSNDGLQRLVDQVFPSDSTYHKALAIITAFWSAV